MREGSCSQHFLRLKISVRLYDILEIALESEEIMRTNSDSVFIL